MFRKHRVHIPAEGGIEISAPGDFAGKAAKACSGSIRVAHVSGGDHEFESEFVLSATIKAPIDVGAGPFGVRRYFEVTGGAIEGKKLNGKVLTGGGDWLLIGTDGFARLDVRAQLLTDDGAFIYMNYAGLLELTEKVGQALATAAVPTSATIISEPRRDLKPAIRDTHGSIRAFT